MPCSQFDVVSDNGRVLHMAVHQLVGLHVGPHPQSVKECCSHVSAHLQ